MKVEKTRLDILLAQRGLAESRSLAQKLIMAGDVRVDGQVVADPSRKVAADALLALEKGPRFVSRGGEKLEPALLDFGLTELTGWVCADVGASTGGFTDCLLQHGALKVYAIDVGYGILHWKMRSDPRVVVMERTNARHVERLPEIPALVTVDASFISLRILLPVIRAWFYPQGPQGQAGQVVALIKPQFEAGKEAVDRGEGVIHDPRIHRQVLEEVLAFAQEQRFDVRGLVKSSLKGPKGNTEFLVHLGLPDEKTASFDRGLIDRALG
jgi:23S rRNA (cytidine1920-2'-O)/16S rRNA (cytidine1409-2'-O)-methyltransferase